MNKTRLITLVAFLAGCPLGKSESTPPPVVSVTDMAKDPTPAGTVLPVLDSPGLTTSVALIPGVGIGPIHLGMSRQDLNHLGLPISDAYAGLQVGPYRVLLEADIVTLVQVHLADLPDGMRVGREVFPATERDIERIAGTLAGCGALENLIGANEIQCAGGVRVSAAGPPGIVMLTVSSS